MGPDLPLQGADLLVERDQDRDQRPHRHGVRRGDHCRLFQVLCAQHRLDRGGFLRDLAAPRTFERRADLREAQPGRAARIRALASNSSVSAASRSSNACTAAGKYSRNACRNRCVARVRSQIRVLCMRVTTLTPQPRRHRRPAAIGASRYGPCRPACARRPHRSWHPTPPGVRDTGPPATGSPRTPCTPRRSTPAPTDRDPSRSRSSPAQRHRHRRRRDTHRIIACSRAIPRHPPADAP